LGIEVICDVYPIIRSTRGMYLGPDQPEKENLGELSPKIQEIDMLAFWSFPLRAG
jgi:hypothetical protein